VPPCRRGAIGQVLVIDLENEDYADTCGPNSPAVYLNSTLLKRGQLVPNYFATSHASLGNYLAQVSGQQGTAAQNDDCPRLNSLGQATPLGSFTDITPGTDAADQLMFPGQVLGDGCVFPAPLKQARGYGTPDALGGADCAHPPIGGVDYSNAATAIDQYATRHNPVAYFHSIIDDMNRCNRHVAPLGTLKPGRNGAADTFHGHLHDDLRRLETTPRFMFVSPNLCNDGHDDPCAAPNVAGRRDAAGRHVGAVLFNKRYIRPGTVNNTGSYNHYSALRSYDDLLGPTSGGDVGLGRLGYAAVPGLLPFGADVFNKPVQH